MNKVVKSAVALGCLAVAGVAYAGIPAGTGVNGSLHDMTKVVGPTADSLGRVCVFCHAPHHATNDSYSVAEQASIAAGDGVRTLDNYPLWNHTFSDQTFKAYAWATPNNDTVIGTITDPLAGPSRLCMTCHDGSVAIDEHSGTWGGAGTTKIQYVGGSVADSIEGEGKRANLTNDLSNTHPIGFSYTNALKRNIAASTDGTIAAQNEIVPADQHYASDVKVSTTEAEGYNTVTRKAGAKTIGDNLFGGEIMTCATCHEVHNKENVKQDSANGTVNYFLYAKEDKSLICLSCHVK